MADRKEGRGRLSTIDQLPPEADADIQWAAGQLLARDRTQADILFELNDRLEAIGCEPISRSAFNRFSTRQAALTRKLTETREIAASVSQAIGPDKADDVTVMVVQLIKQATLELLEKGNLGSKAIMELSTGLKSAIAAQKASGADTRDRDADNEAKMNKAAQTAAAGISKAAPSLDQAEVLAMIRKAYGIGGDQ